MRLAELAPSCGLKDHPATRGWFSQVIRRFEAETTTAWAAVEAVSSRPLVDPETATLAGVLAAFRKRRDEAQWTQIIAGVAAADPGFAPRLAHLLAGLAERKDAASSLLDPPPDVACRAERSVWSLEGEGLGRVDLVFEDPARTYFLLVEHKLGSEYGERQLERYLEALHTSHAARKGLLAITAATPLTGEGSIDAEPHWLGSLRWWRIYDRLYLLPHADPVVAAVWRAALTLLRHQGDFGPMDADPQLVRAWSRRDEAEALLFDLLRELAKPTIEAIEHDLGKPAPLNIKYRGKKEAVVVFPWRNLPTLVFTVPQQPAEERLWVQFGAGGGEPYFSVAARYQHPKESLSGDSAIANATGYLVSHGFACDTDGWGHFWARAVPVDDVFAGAETLDRLVGATRAAIHELAESGLFGALANRSPSTPVQVSEDVPDTDE